MICLLFVATSCLDEHRFGVVSSSKDEVKFSAELKRDAQTRTLYGEDNQATNIKVKWVDGDKVMVFGTTCVPPASENQVGEYTIQISGENTPNNDNSGSKNMSVADNLVKIEEVGVRWGSAETSDFVAVYPSEGASFEYNETSKVVTASTSISATQNYVFSDDMVQKTLANGTKINVWEGTHFANDATNPSMQNAIMYARTDNVPNGDPVSLSFEPFSTVLKFRFEGFESLWSTDAEAYIQSITLKAPTGVNIAGDFDISIPRVEAQSTTPVTAVATGNNSNTITINTIKQGGAYLKIAANQAVEFNVFTLPLDGLTITGDENTSVENLWTVTIQVQGVGDLTYKLLPVDGTDGNAKTYTLVPGYIHKVKVPKMISNKVPEWNPENWITQIPPPVYISELSVPGAWYCTDSNYQDNTDLSYQYSKGIRAFHLDCRLSYDSVSKPAFSNEHTFSETMTLVCAGTETAESSLGYITSLTYKQGVPVQTHMENLLGLVKEDEYIVIVLTIAEAPKNLNYGTGRVEFGTVAPQECLAEINTIIENLRTKYKHKDGTPVIYNKKITEDTIVDEVLGHAIVKVNINTSPDKFLSYDTVPGTLISMGSMAAEGEYMTGDIVGTNVNGDLFKVIQSVPMYWGKESLGLTYHYHQAQRTLADNTTAVGGIPYYSDRIAAIDDVVSKSKGIYDNAQHNAWFQIGIGGSRKNSGQDDTYASQTEVGQRLNPYLYGKVVSKMDTDPSPVGIVLMNHCTNTTQYSSTITLDDGTTKTYTASSQDLVKAIIEMNGKFYLNRQGNDVITGGEGNQNGANQSAVTKSCGNATIGFDAF